MITQPNIDWQWHDATKAAAAKRQADADLRARRTGAKAQPDIAFNGSHADVGVGTRPTQGRSDHFFDYERGSDLMYQDRPAKPALHDTFLNFYLQRGRSFELYSGRCLNDEMHDWRHATDAPGWRVGDDCVRCERCGERAIVPRREKPASKSEVTWNPEFDRSGRGAEFKAWADGVEAAVARRRRERGTEFKEVETSGGWWSSEFFPMLVAAFVCGVAVGVWIILALRALS